MEVETVNWPDEHDRRDELAAARLPRLLLVDTDAAPPVSADPLEDWVRVASSELDVRSRMEGLRERAIAAMAASPVLDDHGVLRFAGCWVSIPPVEARLTRRMLDRFGRVVSRDELAEAGWPDQRPDRNLLDVHVLRLRRRLEPIRLAIRTVRSRGYLLEPQASSFVRHAPVGSERPGAT